MLGVLSKICSSLWLGLTTKLKLQITPQHFIEVLYKYQSPVTNTLYVA